MSGRIISKIGDFLRPRILQHEVILVEGWQRHSIGSSGYFNNIWAGGT